jgi:hypothetical protein
MTTKLRSIWTAKIGDKVHSYAPKHYNARGEITEFLTGSRVNVRLLSGETVTVVLTDLELL